MLHFGRKAWQFMSKVTFTVKSSTCIHMELQVIERERTSFYHFSLRTGNCSETFVWLLNYMRTV